MFKRRRGEVKRSHAYQTAYKRFSGLPNADLLNWADQFGTDLAGAFNDLRRGVPESLIQAQTDVDCLQAAVDVLVERHVN